MWRRWQLDRGGTVGGRWRWGEVKRAEAGRSGESGGWAQDGWCGLGLGDVGWCGVGVGEGEWGEVERVAAEWCMLGGGEVMWRWRR